MVKEYHAAVERALEQTRSVSVLREVDPQVDYVFKTGAWLFDQELDRMAIPTLLRIGGKLTGIYGYLGNLAARARAERDVYTQKLEEVEARLAVETLSDDPKYKVTLMRANIKEQTADLKGYVIAKEYEKNNYEHVLSACDRMVSFIQTAISQKKAEAYRGQMHDNH